MRAASTDNIWHNPPQTYK